MGAKYRPSSPIALGRKGPLLTLVILLLATPGAAALAGPASATREIAAAAPGSAPQARGIERGMAQPPKQPGPVEHIQPAEAAGPWLVGTGPASRRQGGASPAGPAVQLTPEVLFYDDFESDPWPYPTDAWAIDDFSDDNKNRVWNDVSYRSNTGSWSVWPAGGGFDGKIPSPDDDKYFNNLDTWMRYGPFDLTDAQDARLYFYLWRDIKVNDYLFIGASLDNFNFNGPSVDGVEDWTYYYIDLHDYIGNNAVWVGWKFFSDDSGTAAGPYIDDIAVVKYVESPPNVFRLFLPNAIRQEGGPAPTLCDQFEPNDRLSTAFGPLVSEQVYQARMCADDKEDLYYFQASQAGQVQITLSLPPSLYPEASLYLYAPDGRTLISGCYNAPPQGGRTGTPNPIVVSCAVTAGKQTVRVTSKGTTNPANEYSLKVKYP